MDSFWILPIFQLIMIWQLPPQIYSVFSWIFSHFYFDWQPFKVFIREETNNNNKKNNEPKKIITYIKPMSVRHYLISIIRYNALIDTIYNALKSTLEERERKKIQFRNWFIFICLSICGQEQKNMCDMCVYRISYFIKIIIAKCVLPAYLFDGQG